MRWCRGVGVLGAAVFAFLCSVQALALDALPSEITLHRLNQSQRVLVGTWVGDLWTDDVTAQAGWASADTKVVRVREDGRLEAVGAGTTTVSATVQGQTATVTVTVALPEAVQPWSFRNDIQPLLYKMGCSTGACHGAASGKSGFKLSLRGYDHPFDHQVITRQAKGRRVSVADPDQSLVLLKPTMDVPHEGGERFTKDSDAYRRLRDWIAQGAPPAADADARIEHIEVLPAQMKLAPGGGQPIVVQAHYSDGHSADVTEWVKLDTTDDAVLMVDDDGLITVTGSGAASVTGWYASQVASTSITVPRAKAVDVSVYAKAANYGFIDELVLRKLRSLNIAPSKLAGDATFIRRAYLDAIGVLPTAKETQAFLADNAPDKRIQLVDALLERPEWTDYWTHMWSDLFLVSSTTLRMAEDRNALYRFIRENVEQNVPWDDFARAIITANGNTRENGAANYFLMHKDITDLTETTSQAFLGMSLTCARCHNHPLEKWTQDQYYGFANLLAQVTMKNNDAGGTDVLSSRSGDLIHPRYGAALTPQPLDGDPIPADWASDRRNYLADWLTDPVNPYFTRAIVNRVWANFMGKGLVDPVDDLRLTNPPSNAVLLDALGTDLVENEYDLKALMRRIMTSAAYQRSSKPADPDAPDDTHYAQYIVRRLKAEVILDTYAQVTGVPTPFSGYPEGYRSVQLRDSNVASYFLEAFGRPERRQTCTCERTDDASIAQTLHLANGNTLNDKLKHERFVFASMTADPAGDAAVVDALFYRALCRPPRAAERERALAAMVAERDPAGKRQAVEDITWAVLTSKEYLFNH
jgi:hypothetical protein